MTGNKKHPPRLMTAPQTIVAGFLIVIMIGALLLTLPVCSADGGWTGFDDALFTATTSVCVTGLTTVTTAAHWSLFGKLVILVLIQLGGLGVITVFSAFMILAGHKLMLRESVLVQEQYNLDSVQGITALIKRVIFWTFGIELLGALAYSFAFVPRYGLARGCWYSVFHAVSSFCNAGIDIIGQNSLMPFVGAPLVNLTTELLVIAGSIGYIVLWDTKEVLCSARRREIRFRQIFGRLTLHSKLAYTITAILLFGGFVCVLLFEWNNPDTLGGLGLWNKLQAAFFESVTLRTAGMATLPQESLREETLIVCMVLMFIGGSPMGTAGGVKTTTIGIVLLTVWAQIMGKPDTEVFNRKVTADNIRTALSVVVFSVAGHILITLLLLATQDGTLTETLFEVVSALGTVGLTLGMTGKLTVLGKLLICFAMYLGRIGPITIAIAFTLRKKNYRQLRKLPEKRVIIG